MINVQAMLKCRVLLPLHLNKILHQRTFRHREWLCDNNVVFIGKQIKRVFNEVKTTGLVKFVDAEQVYDNGIKGVKGNYRKLVLLKTGH